MQYESRSMIRSTLILVLKTLISQWIKQIHLIALDQFDVKKYHENIRQHRLIANELTINEHLTKNYEIFDDRKKRTSIIVIFSFTTWAHRYKSKI